MKNAALVVTVALAVTACGSTGKYVTADNYGQFNQEQYAAQSRNTMQQVDQAPKWMFNLPRAQGVVFESATAVSSDFAMADMKAKTLAYAKICKSAGGQVRSQMKMYRNDSDASSTESSELTVRSICPDVDITGVETVEMKHVAEGNRIRSYVLVALPVGSNNAAKASKEARARAPQAFDELDEVTGNAPTGRQAPQATPSSAPAAQGQTASVVNPDGTSGKLNLLPVENAEYKAKRDSALQKPGAVVGQVTVPM